MTFLCPGDIVPVSNRHRWRRGRNSHPERGAAAGSALWMFQAGTTPEPLANAECRMQNAEWASPLLCVPFGRKLCRARPLQRSQATACFGAVSRVEPWDVLDYLRLTPDTLRGEAFCFAPTESPPCQRGEGREAAGGFRLKTRKPKFETESPSHRLAAATAPFHKGAKEEVICNVRRSEKRVYL